MKRYVVHFSHFRHADAVEELNNYCANNSVIPIQIQVLDINEINRSVHIYAIVEKIHNS